MKKMSLIATSLLLGASVLISPITQAYAEGSDVVVESEGTLTTPIEKDIKSYSTSTPGSASALAVDYSGTYYQMSEKKTYNKVEWTASYSNGGKKDDSVSRKVTRTKFANGKAGLAAESKVNYKIIQGKVTINGEGSWGKSTSVETNNTWTLEGKSKTTIEFGSSAVHTKGNIVKYNRGKLVRKDPVDVKYSYQEYSIKKVKSL